MRLPKWIFHSDTDSSMLKSSHILAAILLLVFPNAASAASLADKFTPGTPYYFDHFDPGQKPWEPGQYLNIEELFKNYQYFEIVFDQDGKGITVYRYLRGSKEDNEKYLVLPDKSLQKK
jgi:hypothetical protein